MHYWLFFHYQPCLIRLDCIVVVLGTFSYWELPILGHYSWVNMETLGPLVF